MKKWIDDIEKQIDAIEAGEVDAKNLSEVLDKDAPVTLTTDLQNNKVKVGLDIDSNTLEVNNGKLKVKAGGSGAKKYLHRVRFYFGDYFLNDIIPTSNNLYAFKTIITDSPTAFTRESLISYIQQHNSDFINNTDILSQMTKLLNNNGFAICRQFYYDNSRLFVQFFKYEFNIVEGAIKMETNSVVKYASLSQYTTYWDILDKVTEL